MTRTFNWLNQCRALMYDAYFPPFWPALEFDADRAVQSAKRLRANTFRIGSLGKYAYYPTKQWVTHPQLGKRDVLKEMISVAHAAGMRVIVYIPVGHALPSNLLKKHHPEWMYQPNPDDKEPPASRVFAGDPISAACLNGPYAKTITRIVREVVGGYDLDAVYFDGFVQGWGFGTICYCPCCRMKHAARFGEPLPRPVQGREANAQESKALARARDWNRAMGGELFVPLAEWIRARKQIPILFNRNSPDDDRWDRRILDGVDGFLYEAGEDFLHRIQGIGLGVARGQMVWQYVGRWDNWPRLSTFKRELLLEAMATRMSGGANIIPGGPRYLWDARDAPTLERAFRHQRRLEQIAPRAAPVKFCAVLHSGQSVPVAESEGAHRSWDLRGAFAALQFGRVQCTTIPQEVLLNRDLVKEYQVLVLPNVAALSHAACQTIEEFVRAGGGLVATYATSLFDENGNRRKHPGLEKVFGISVRAPDSKLAARIAQHTRWGKDPFDVYLQPAPEAPAHLMDRQRLLPAARYLLVTPAKTEKAAAHLVTGTQLARVGAGLVLKDFGKGRVAYLASELEYLYWQMRCPEIRKLFCGLARWAAAGRLPYEIAAPEGVLANLNAQPGILVLHLLNVCGGGHELPKANRESVCPIPDIHVRLEIPADEQVQSVTSMTDGKPLKFRITARGLTLIVPVLTEYEAVVVKLRSTKR
ncbi:MAG: beta-galactosidase trimerization domain-containing protein [Verrucomicrobia bacterium]|nr:beta-galactosidase trimerization domain-containing protein [Verrucomicrobiota bacterium]